MDAVLGIAGLVSVLLGIGHETLGLRWVLPDAKKQDFSRTPFGPPGMTLAMINASWHIITVFAVSTGALLLTLAWAEDSDPKTVLLRVFSAMWFTVAVVAIGSGSRRVARPRDLAKLPVPILFVLVSVLCWIAST
jgi:hypothetical protein